ncbi:MAG: hypothetical protein LBD82_04695 [Deltaproteobacteria bacterium]|jgi:hypothetical protein|nr:hypothetical protein [Deltaproteobacteria bacterium]
MHKPIVYIPTLHAELAPAGLPCETLFLRPGLPLPSGGEERGVFLPDNLPWGPDQADSVLRELLALGSVLNRDAPQEPVRTHFLKPLRQGVETLPAEERAYLENFAHSGQVGTDKNILTRQGTARGRMGLQEAQKTLLLAWEHEENILALNALERVLEEKQARLHGYLGEGEREESVSAPEHHAPAYSWRAVLGAMGAFLPTGALLLSAHTDLCAELREQGSLRPLPEELRASLNAWPDYFTAGLGLAVTPLRTLAHMRDADGSRPWLDEPRTILAAERETYYAL